MKSALRRNSLLELQDLRRPGIEPVLFPCIPANFHFLYCILFVALDSLFSFTLFVPPALIFPYVLFSGFSYSDVEICGFSVRK
jgi:hypothetical protein